MIRSLHHSVKSFLHGAIPLPISCLSEWGKMHFAGDIFGDKQFLIEAEVLGGGLNEALTSSNDLAIEGVDNWVGFLEEAVDAADLLQIEFPF